MRTTRQFTRPVVLLAALALTAVAATSVRSEDAPTASSAQEELLLSVLRSDASGAEKAMTCKKLAIDGSSAAVPELAKLLTDPRLASWARIALEAIPGEASDEALRLATDSLEGRLLVGTINSIGVRRDADAVEMLTTRLQDDDADVASAAAVALGRIGGADAAESLRKSLAVESSNVRSSIAEGCVLCAERLVSEGKLAEATEIYDEVRHADVPVQRVVEATRGAILSRGQQGIPLLLEQLRSPEKVMFQLALGTAREIPGGEIDQELANELDRATPRSAALIIQTMADRPQTVVVAAVLKAAVQGDKQVRMSAIDALQRVGDHSCLAALLEIAMESDGELAEAARETLAELPGEDVDSRIVQLLPESGGDSYAVLLQLVGRRRVDAADELLNALDHSNQDVRHAALIALGETVTLEQLSVLVSQVVSPKYPEDRAVSQLALKAASIRMPDREACADQLATALERSSATSKTILLEILADVGGVKALNTLATSAKSDDPELQDTGSRLLGKWSSVDAAPVLLDLAKTAPGEKYQIRALRGYISLARRFDMPEPHRVEMCRQALEVARKPAEQKLVLDVLELHPSTAAMDLAIHAMRIPNLKEQASQASLVIAQKLGGKEADLSELLSSAGLDKVKLEIVKAEYGSGSTQKDVTAVLRKQTRDLPLITLSSGSYNASFGGDPVPGTKKQLRIQYRINGKAGDATFAENATIILPIPK